MCLFLLSASDSKLFMRMGSLDNACKHNRVLLTQLLSTEEILINSQTIYYFQKCSITYALHGVTRRKYNHFFAKKDTPMNHITISKDLGTVND